MGTKILNSRWFYVVLSILLAFLLWVYVGNDPNSVDTGTLRNVRVVFSGLEKLEERGLMIDPVKLRVLGKAVYKGQNHVAVEQQPLTLAGMGHIGELVGADVELLG